MKHTIDRTVPPNMKAVLLTGHGDYDRLDLRDDVPVPHPGATDVLIHVAAAGVNNTDINLRTGWYSKEESADDAGWGGSAINFPLIQGADVCGYIVAAGERVPPTRVGQRVVVEPTLWEWNGRKLTTPLYLGSDCNGGFAEYVVVPARHAFPVDSSLTDQELASFPCSSSTAENLCRRSGVASGDRVLVTGASGGVGSAAVQLAKARGATVIAVAHPDKAQRVREIGADQVIPRGTSPVDVLGREAVDVVIDLVGGAGFPTLLDLLKPTGRYAVSGAIGGPIVELDLRTLYLKDLRMIGGTIIDREVFPALIRWIETGRLRPAVAEVFPLENIVDAQKTFLAKRHVGKLVLDIAGA